MRTVTVEVKVKLTLKCNEDIDISKRMGNLLIYSGTDSFEVEDMSIEDYEVTDSR